ncbi:hypothetical protein BUALT_Bualt04G0055700 [Buddleja alternifolia]|uniref:Bifunctional inhibitor/plant lipid transfer protein/seed storage helical domain-containing protein n=1 Tax=Buddleja alternifolia TaxID=168488 RepID=A0AAV6XLK4_9LAMI|nr:hypothetical protein BUALT_Bualt04G0055700 [Buddleja alternifolia]
MARFTVFIVTLIVLSAATAISPYHAASTTTTTVEIVNPRESEQCRQQIGLQRLSSCQQYLRSSSRFESSIMPENESGWRETFPQCCEDLEQINEECRCEAIKQIAQQERQVERVQGREMREMLQTAQSLPALCRISPRYCQNIPGGSGTMF